MQQQAAQMAQQEMNSQAANDALLAADNTIEEVEEDDDAEVDEEGLNAADIEVIINQVRRNQCSSIKDAGTDIELL
jgi:nascent polypeptide-associated complex subunit alpha